MFELTRRPALRRLPVEILQREIVCVLVLNGLLHIEQQRLPRALQAAHQDLQGIHEDLGAYDSIAETPERKLGKILQLSHSCLRESRQT